MSLEDSCLTITPASPEVAGCLMTGTGWATGLMTASAGPADLHGGGTESEPSPAPPTLPSVVRGGEPSLCPSLAPDRGYTERG